MQEKRGEVAGVIRISRLRIAVFIGVPDEERAEAQDIEVSLELVPQRSLLGTDDDIAATIDYYAVSQRLIAVAQERPRRLIEQLNEDLLRMVLREFPVLEAEVCTYKFIIPDTQHVAVSLRLTREAL